MNTACANKYPQVLADSRSLIRTLEHRLVPRNSILVTVDIVSMYPNVDTELAIDACCHTVDRPQAPMVQDMLDFVLKNSYVRRGNSIYKQASGLAMGTACAPPVANIHIARNLEDAIRTSHPHLWPEIYHRFIDDGFFIWTGTQEDLDAFIHLLDSTLVNIRITTHQHRHKVPYLDAWIIKDMAGDGDMVPLYFETFQKPHNQYLYIPYFSFHRPHVFRAWVKTELLRYAVNSTREIDFLHISGLFHKRLIDRGYPENILLPIFTSVQHSDRVNALQPIAHVDSEHFRNTATPATAPVAASTTTINTTPAATPAAVFITPYGTLEKCMNLNTVINSVYEKYSHMPELHSILGDRIVVAYHNSPSLGKLIVKATN